MAFWDSWKRHQKPKEQFYGGSKEGYAAAQKDYAHGRAVGQATQTAGLQAAYDAASQADDRYGLQNSQLEQQHAQQGQLAGQADKGFTSSMANYAGGRQGQLADAQTIERDASNLQSNYQTTADKQAALNRLQNQRSALSLVAGRGSSGLRAALASSTNANANAAGQAEITRAQETNQLATMKQNALAAAAGVRSGVAGQDQSAGQLFAGRSQNAYANQANANAQEASNIGASATTQQNAGQLAAATGSAQQGQFLDAQSNMENAQLNAEREREQLRIEGNRTRYNRLMDPLGLHGGK